MLISLPRYSGRCGLAPLRVAVWCAGRAGVHALDYAPLLHRINVSSNQYHRILRLIKKHLSRVPRSIGVPLKAALGECSSSLRCVCDVL